jgi:hypothetical protein
MQNVSRHIDICYTMAVQTTRSLYLLSDFFDIAVCHRLDSSTSGYGRFAFICLFFFSKQLITMEPSFHSLRHFWNID